MKIAVIGAGNVETIQRFDAINSSMAREGKRLGVPTPVNEVMVVLAELQEEKDCT